MKVVGWRAHYRGGVTFDSSEARPVELPADLPGVVEFLERPYRRIVDGGDWLWWEDGRWHASGTVWGGWVEKPHPDAIRGLALPDDEWEAVRRRMIEDRDWPDG